MNKKTLFGFGVLGMAALSSAFSVNAEVLYQAVESSTYGQANGANSIGEFAGVNVTVDGSDTARLITRTSTATGSTFWAGSIPASAVTVLGAHRISVQIDTCSINPADGCGYVDATITADPKDGGFITDGSLHYNWSGLIQTVAGPTQVRYSNVTGFVNGVSLDGVRGFLGKYTRASIMVETAQ